MLDDFLQDQAALYATGNMPSEAREQFEVLLEFHTELRALVTDLTRGSGGGEPFHAARSRCAAVLWTEVAGPCCDRWPQAADLLRLGGFEPGGSGGVG